MQPCNPTNTKLVKVTYARCLQFTYDLVCLRNEIMNIQLKSKTQSQNGQYTSRNIVIQTPSYSIETSIETMPFPCSFWPPLIGSDIAKKTV